MDITDEPKLFLDAGIVPVIFAGNEKSKHVFEKNKRLCGRLGHPFELYPLSARANVDRMLFKTFYRDLEKALVGNLVLRRNPSDLDTKTVLPGLLSTSRGHVGRVVRIVEAAMEHAASRDAAALHPQQSVRSIAEKVRGTPAPSSIAEVPRPQCRSPPASTCSITGQIAFAVVAQTLSDDKLTHRQVQSRLRRTRKFSAETSIH